MQVEAVIGDGLAQHALELPPRLQLGVHLRPEKALAARSLGLGMEEGDVGALHQGLGVLAMGGRERGADAGGAFDVAVLQMERLAQCRGEAAGERLDLVGVAHDLRQPELVAAEPRQKILGVAEVPEAARDLLQHLVAGGVPERVVHLLEAVDVHGVDRDRAPERYGLVEVLHEARAVQEPGQRVVIGEELGARIGCPLLPRAPVEADGRQAEGGCDDAAEQDRRAGDLRAEHFALGRLVDIDLDDAGDLSVRHDRHIGFRIEGRPVRRGALLHLDVGLALQHRLGGMRIVDEDRLDGMAGLPELVGGKPEPAIGVENLVEEDVADFLRLLEEGHALCGWLAARGDNVEVLDVGGEVACPGFAGRRGVLVQHRVDRARRHEDGRPHGDHQEGDEAEAEKDVATGG